MHTHYFVASATERVGSALSTLESNAEPLVGMQFDEREPDAFDE